MKQDKNSVDIYLVKVFNNSDHQSQLHGHVTCKITGPHTQKDATLVPFLPIILKDQLKSTPSYHHLIIFFSPTPLHHFHGKKSAF